MSPLTEWIHKNQEIWMVVCVLIGYMLGRVRR
jgi:hypothetical protein